MMQNGIDARSSTPTVSPRKPKIRIVLVEDHAILREGLKALIEIESDFDIVGEFGCVEDCLLGIVDLNADLLLTDLALPGRSGIELLTEMQGLCPLMRKLVLTAHENEEYIRAALNAGANGYVLKDANSEQNSFRLPLGACARRSADRRSSGRAVHHGTRTRSSHAHCTRQFQQVDRA